MKKDELRTLLGRNRMHRVGDWITEWVDWLGGRIKRPRGTPREWGKGKKASWKRPKSNWKALGLTFATFACFCFWGWLWSTWEGQVDVMDRWMHGVSNYPVWRSPHKWDPLFANELRRRQGEVKWRVEPTKSIILVSSFHSHPLRRRRPCDFPLRTCVTMNGMGFKWGGVWKINIRNYVAADELLLLIHLVRCSSVSIRPSSVTSSIHTHSHWRTEWELLLSLVAQKNSRRARTEERRGDASVQVQR